MEIKHYHKDKLLCTYYMLYATPEKVEDNKKQLAKKMNIDVREIETKTHYKYEIPAKDITTIHNLLFHSLSIKDISDIISITFCGIVKPCDDKQYKVVTKYVTMYLHIN